MSTDSRVSPEPLNQEDRPPPPTMQQHLQRWRLSRDQAIRGDDQGTRRQHAKGKLTVRQRLDRLLDQRSFVELDLFRRRQETFGLGGQVPTDGVVTGSGTVDGRRVFVYAQDFRVFGGSLGEAHAAKIHKVMDLALAAGAPLIALTDGGGARIQEGVSALAGYGGIFRRNVRASGVIPQISVIMGPCAGGAAYSPALTDFIFMVNDTALMFVTGPDVVKAVTGESISHGHLGGAQVHAARSGVATFVREGEVACLAAVRRVLSLLPQNCHERPPSHEPRDPAERRCDRLLDIVPADPRKPYDMRDVIREIVDDGEFIELHEQWAKNIVCTLARMGGGTVGIVASQPRVRAGALDIAASEKAARFVRTCDSFNIPLVTLVDVPGFLPSVQQEHQGIIRHGAKLLYAYCEATVPRIQVVLRKAYGGAYIVMDSRSVGADLSFAWPTNEIAVMGAKAAIAVINRKEIAAAADPSLVHTRLAAEYADHLIHPYYAAERGLVDDVIDPRDTRSMIIRGLAIMRDKQPDLVARKHGNPPL